MVPAGCQAAPQILLGPSPILPLGSALAWLRPQQLPATTGENMPFLVLRRGRLRHLPGLLARPWQPSRCFIPQAAVWRFCAGRALSPDKSLAVPAPQGEIQSPWALGVASLIQNVVYGRFAWFVWVLWLVMPTLLGLVG